MVIFYFNIINSGYMCDMFGFFKYFNMRIDKNGYLLKKFIVGFIKLIFK